MIFASPYNTSPSPFDLIPAIVDFASQFDAPAHHDVRDAAHRQHVHKAPAQSYTPPIDVYDADDKTTIYASLPGVKKTDIEISYDAGKKILGIAGQGGVEYRHPVPELTQAAIEEKKDEEMTDATTTTEVPEIVEPVSESEKETSEKSAEKSEESKPRRRSVTVEDVPDGVDDDFAVVTHPGSTTSPSPTAEKAVVKVPKPSPAPAPVAKTAGPIPRVREIPYGTFTRHIPLARFLEGKRVDEAGITAKLEDGVLTIEVPKIVLEGRKRIAVF
ncbi:hypothetical protein YB2330_001922 [Saitoella coloradoensis]